MKKIITISREFGSGGHDIGMEVAKRLGHSRPSHTLNLYGHAIPGYDSQMPSLVEKVFNIENCNREDILAASCLALPSATEKS